MRCSLREKNLRANVTVQARRLVKPSTYHSGVLKVRKNSWKRFHFRLLPNHVGKCWHLPTWFGKIPFCLPAIMLCKCVCFLTFNYSSDNLKWELEIEVAVELCCDSSMLRCAIHQLSTRSSPWIRILYISLSQNIGVKNFEDRLTLMSEHLN